MMGSITGEIKCKGRNEGRKFWKVREDGKTSGTLTQGMLRLKSGPNLDVAT